MSHDAESDRLKEFTEFRQRMLDRIEGEGAHAGAPPPDHG